MAPLEAQLASGKGRRLEKPPIDSFNGQAYLALMTLPAITFDKLAYVDRLKESGVDEKQARAHAEALDLALRDTVATKADVADAKKELETKIEIVAATLKVDILRWLIVTQVAVAGVILAALKFLR